MVMATSARATGDGGAASRDNISVRSSYQSPPSTTQKKKHQSLGHAVYLTKLESQGYRQMWSWDLLELTVIPTQGVLQAGTEEVGQRP